MDSDKKNNVLENLPLAYARHKIIAENNAKPVDYIFLDINKAFEEMTGLERNKVCGQRVSDILPGIAESDFDWIGIYGAVALQGKSFTFEQYSDPLDRWYEIRAYSDEPGYFTTIFNEITARKREIESMRLLLDMSDKLHFIEDPEVCYNDAVKDLGKLAGAKYTAINIYDENREKSVTKAITGLPGSIDKASKMLGFEVVNHAWDIQHFRVTKIRSERLVRYKSLAEASAGAIKSKLADLLQDIFQVGDIYVMEISSGDPNILGDIIFFMAPGRVLKQKEAIGLYVDQLGAAIGRSQAERTLKKMNAELNQQVRERTVVDSFTSSVAHDLKAPLRRIAGFSEALMEGHSMELSVTALDYLSRIHRQVGRMDELIEAMLRLSEVAKHELEREKVNLSSLFENHINKLRYLSPERQVKTVLAPNIKVNGDPYLLRVAMENLIDNAWKFTSDKDQALIEMGVHNENNRHIYYIRDNGIGFDTKHAEKLFLPFQSLHQTNQITGTAIGLNLVYRIIVRHGGEIWAESEPGRATTFFFTIP